MSPPLFAGSKFRFIPDIVISSKCNGINLETDWQAFSEKEATVILPNIHHCKDPNERKRYNVSYYLMDSQDCYILEQTMEDDGKNFPVKLRVIKSLTDVSKLYKKRIYIRCLPGKNDTPRVFCDDILEVIPIVLGYQGTKVGFSETQKLEKYKKKWKSDVDYVIKTIDLEKFEAIMEEFDANKQLITIIEDPLITLTKDEALHKGGIIVTYSLDASSVVDISRALYFIFTAVVEGVNWKNDKCRFHDYCLNRLKTEILKVMRRYVDFGEGAYIKMSHIMKDIDNVKKLCTRVYMTYEHCPDYYLHDRNHDATMTTAHYIATARHFQLPEYKTFIESSQMLVWMMRVFFGVGWIENFLAPNRSNDIREGLVNAYLALAPAAQRRAMRAFMENTFEETAQKMAVPQHSTTGFSKPMSAPKQESKQSKPNASGKGNTNHNATNSATGKKTGARKKRSSTSANTSGSSDETSGAVADMGNLNLRDGSGSANATGPSSK